MDFDFYLSTDFEKLPEATASPTPHLNLMVMMGEDGQLTGDFRLALTGSQEFQLMFTGDDFYPHAALHPFRFIFTADPEEVVIPVNRTAGPWTDLRDLVSAGSAMALPNQADHATSFLEDWSQLSGAPSPPGAALRWAVAVEEDGGLALHLQGLPMSAAALTSRPALAADDAPAKLLGRVGLSFTRFRQLGQQSIKPLIYARDPAAAAAAVSRDFRGFARRLVQLWQRFLTPEYVDGEQVDQLLARPRSGRVERPLGSRPPPVSDLAPTAPPADQDLAGRTVPLSLYRSAAAHLGENVRRRVLNSVSPATWAKYLTAWRNYEEFCQFTGAAAAFPISPTQILDFTSYHDLRGVSVTSLKAYIGSLSQLQQLCGLPGISIRGQPLLYRFLKGAENLPAARLPLRRRRRAVSLPLLKILGHHLALSSIPTEDKIFFWTAAVAAFFGSLRLGEILADRVKRPSTLGLRGEDCHPAAGELALRVRSHKAGHAAGDLVVLFPLSDPSLCPVRHLLALCRSKNFSGPLFVRSSGQLWTRQHFSAILQDLANKTGLFGPGETITGHSFRAGIASALGALGTADGELALREWGRWRSFAFTAYTRQHVAAKRAIFDRIKSALLI